MQDSGKGQKTQNLAVGMGGNRASRSTRAVSTGPPAAARGPFSGGACLSVRRSGVLTVVVPDLESLQIDMKQTEEQTATFAATAAAIRQMFRRPGIVSIPFVGVGWT